jgi:hypothetical protein
VILGKATDDASTTDLGRLPTIDELFRSAVAHTPGALALLDPPDRDGFADGMPHRLTYSEADRIVSAIARRLSEFGLPLDTVVAVQLPNIVESVLVLLGIMRAGMIAAPLPLLWRQAEMTAALGSVSARVLVTARRVGTVDHGDIATHAAAATFAIRFVCGFGEPLPDGVMTLDSVFDAADDVAAAVPRRDSPADHVAVITFDVTADGMGPVARSHAELVAVGASVVSEVGTNPCAVIVSALATSSLAGLATVIMPWLLTAGTLALHHPFAANVFAAQCAAEHATITAVPGPLLPTLAEAELLAPPVGPAAVLAVWRAPERLAATTQWRNIGATVVDVSTFGEIGLIVGRRQPDGTPAVAALGPLAHVRQSGSSPLGIEAKRTMTGTLAVRGAMVPRNSFPPGTRPGDPLGLRIDDAGFVDTLHPCQLDPGTGRLFVTGPPAGVVSVGGYRFSMRELQRAVQQIDPDGTVAALPDTLAGHRLAGISEDRETVWRLLAESGSNPLILTAFRERCLQGSALLPNGRSSNNGGASALSQNRAQR